MSTATLEERIYQRQILKEEVAAAVVDRGAVSASSESDRHFSPNELKKLFAPPHETKCDTYDLITQMKSHRRVTLKGQEEEESEDEEMEDTGHGDDDEEEEEGEEEESSEKEKERKRKVKAKRDVLFQLYTGLEDVNDSVLKNVIENDDENVVTFVRTTSTTDA